MPDVIDKRPMYLRFVNSGRHEMDGAREDFKSQVRKARAAGCTIRQIADAAGYASTSQIQRIVKED